MKSLPTAKQGLNGSLIVPGDKSISHRALMFGAMANGTTTILNRLDSADVTSTMNVLRSLGAEIDIKSDTVTEVVGHGIAGLKDPNIPLDMGNSGTSTRLLTGLMAGAGIEAEVHGDNSLSKRPMDRIIDPLTEIGANIDSQNGHLPLQIHQSKIASKFAQTLKVGSAQVKSSILLAGLAAGSDVTLTDSFHTRNHTEAMLPKFGVKVDIEGDTIHIPADQILQPTEIEVPGDISSAAFWIVAGLITPNSKLTIKNVGVNETRTGIITVLKEMGANISIDMKDDFGEPIADITVTTSQLHGIEVGGSIIPSLIDELPIIVLASTQATGTTVIKDAAELHVKETDRIETVQEELTKLGADVTPTSDGFIINGETPLQADNIHVFGHGDHRIAMMLSIAALITDGSVILDDDDSVKISYPTFFENLEGLV
ncbi:3-phosphoshikimate 1-carboxyvinyltransferase [Companilactobacillus mishanensis]|uniref:3-phosphoshikimate 1-carboxyvinyltransferase n=1 Tax=Companilactobacillus mishanensis TaxID=2486008 RepID=A0A5P0ZJ34_9LACO|nr:3-phosphoshikimate 1-carboxyvinyltransferase [Companilactobacillus mishanensis]MQS53084.1 3-phosphoshikimate 1-carboxyvinyltransferase [Companilactobacillus mishanensis]